MFAGDGIEGGHVVGASEKFGSGVVERKTPPMDLLATIYQKLGIPLDTHFNDASRRPTSIIDTGHPIRELS